MFQMFLDYLTLVWFGLVSLIWLSFFLVWLIWFGLVKFGHVGFLLVSSESIFTNKQTKKKINGVKYRVAAQLKIRNLEQ